jgi:hypothetical protein
MKKQLAAVEKFHDSFGIINKYSPSAELSRDTIILRYKLMREENEEYL